MLGVNVSLVLFASLLFVSVLYIFIYLCLLVVRVGTVVWSRIAIAPAELSLALVSSDSAGRWTMADLNDLNDSQIPTKIQITNENTETQRQSTL
jgi:hypothetical protein